MMNSSLRSRCRSGAGFTIVGMLVAFVILGLVMSPLIHTLVTAQEGFVKSRQRARTASSVRYAHLALTRFLRNAGSSPYSVAIAGIDPDPRGDGVFDDVRIRADYNPADGDTDDLAEDLTFYVRADTMFMRSGSDGVEQPYLIGVDSLAFEYYDWNGNVITNRDRVTERAASVRIVVRGPAGPGAPAVRTLAGLVRLRNGG